MPARGGVVRKAHRAGQARWLLVSELLCLPGNVEWSLSLVNPSNAEIAWAKALEAKTAPVLEQAVPRAARLLAASWLDVPGGRLLRGESVACRCAPADVGKALDDLVKALLR